MLTETQALAEEIHKLQAQTGQDRKRIGELVQERTGLATRMRDRDEELRGKAKLLEVGWCFFSRVLLGVPTFPCLGLACLGGFVFGGWGGKEGGVC